MKSKILIASLQVSTDGSKGHLHPALELALEAKDQGHEVAILPLPSKLGPADEAQLLCAQVEYILPPALPAHVIRTPRELLNFALDSTKAHLAYQSFLLDPLPYQLEKIATILKAYAPDVVVYDMLVYGAPIAARRLGILDIGYCAGLKLIAPNNLQGFYRSVAARIKKQRASLCESEGLNLDFHHLELLSNIANLVFANQDLICHGAENNNVHCIGPLHPSRRRDNEPIFSIPTDHYAVLCFGSVLDAADHPQILQSVFELTSLLQLKLLVGSKKLAASHSKLPSHVTAYPYLPLPRIISEAQFYIHHGGANSFSEALIFGAKQILIPLVNDQPIQAHFLKTLGAGFTLAPHDVTRNTLLPIALCLMDKKDEIHIRIEHIARECQNDSGAKKAIHLIQGLNQK
jgi:zeaxanthin glucosyltransferase